jgi:quinohemoprotein amine dehydrogenase beta subunit
MRFSTRWKLGTVLAAACLAAACSDKAPEGAGAGGDAQAAAPAGPHDFMAVANRPNQVHLVDLTERKVVRSCELPGRYGNGTLQMAADGRTAYVLSNQFENIYGVNLDTCEITFTAVQSEGDVRVKTIAAIAVSPDGSEVYAHQNPVRLLKDRYEVMDSRVVVYRTADGTQARPVRSFPAPRQVILMQTGNDGTLYLAGADIYTMDTHTGEVAVKLASRNATDPRYGPKDVLSIWPIGRQSGEFIRMYTAPRFTDEARSMDKAEFMWGYERIDLATGEATSRDFGPLTEVLFTGMTRPGKPNELYAALTRLKKYDVEKQQLLASVDLDHSYYCVNFSTDGNTVYLAGTYNEIAIFDADTLQSKGKIVLPGGDMSLATAQVFRRE